MNSPFPYPYKGLFSGKMGKTVKLYDIIELFLYFDFTILPCFEKFAPLVDIFSLFYYLLSVKCFYINIKKGNYEKQENCKF